VLKRFETLVLVLLGLLVLLIPIPRCGGDEGPAPDVLEAHASTAVDVLDDGWPSLD